MSDTKSESSDHDVGAETSAAAGAEPADTEGSNPKSTHGKDKKSKKRKKKRKKHRFTAKQEALIWLAAILMVLSVELYVYGMRGEIRVCVGKEGHTDFSLDGQERTDQNRWRFPTCETRRNLGMRTIYDEQREHALAHACRRATMLRFKEEAPLCFLGESGWQVRTTDIQVPPWDPRLYRRLLWLD